MSEGKNQPNRIESWILQDDEKPLTLVEDAKIPNAVTVTLRCQDHTMGNMLRSQLLLDPTVLFAGYKVPHPLENKIELRIQTDDQSNPADALKRACTLLISQALSVKRQFTEQARNIDIGMGPEAAPAPGMGMGMPMGMGMGTQPGAGAGGYDPYGDGFGGTQTQGGDVYDF